MLWLFINLAGGKLSKIPIFFQKEKQDNGSWIMERGGGVSRDRGSRARESNLTVPEA